MCDPSVMAIASAVSAATGVAGTVANYFGAQSAQKQQEKEYQAWAQNQRRVREAENVRQEELRSQAQQAQQRGLEDISAESQKKAQDTEEARLTDYLQGKGPNPAEQTVPLSESDKTLSGQAGGDPQFTEDLARKINEATGDARKRIAALAKVSSFGGSYGGLDQTVSQALQRSGSTIDQMNDARRGSIGAFKVEQGVDPISINYQPSPLANIAGDLVSFGSQGLGGMFAGKVAPQTVKYTPANTTGKPTYGTAPLYF
jgi:hypothetical protein